MGHGYLHRAFDNPAFGDVLHTRGEKQCGTPGIGVVGAAHAVLVAVDQVSFDYAIEEARYPAGQLTRPQTILQRSVQAYDIPGFEIIGLIIGAVAELAVNLVTQRLTGRHHAHERVPGTAAELDAGRQPTKRVGFVVFTARRLHAEERCNPKRATRLVFLMYGITAEHGQITKAGRPSRHALTAGGDLQLIIHVRQNAKDSEPWAHAIAQHLCDHL